MEQRVRGEGAPFLGASASGYGIADAGEEHGRHEGLGWIGGTVRAFTPAPGLRIPHMGWNDIVPGFAHPVLAAGEAWPSARLSFRRRGARRGDERSWRPFTAAVAKDNIVGVQFHPEEPGLWPRDPRKIPCMAP